MAEFKFTLTDAVEATANSFASQLATAGNTGGRYRKIADTSKAIVTSKYVRLGATEWMNVDATPTNEKNPLINRIAAYSAVDVVGQKQVTIAKVVVIPQSYKLKSTADGAKLSHTAHEKAVSNYNAFIKPNASGEMPADDAAKAAWIQKGLEKGALLLIWE